MQCFTSPFTLRYGGKATFDAASAIISKTRKNNHSHNRAGKGAPLSLAVPDQEGPIPASLQQLLRLLPFHAATVPAPLLPVAVVCQGVWAGRFYVIKIRRMKKKPLY